MEWGCHFCMFYHTKEELLSILVPYITAGIEGNEACVWVTSGLIDVHEATASLEKAVPDLDQRLKAGQIEIIKAQDWYTKSGKFDSKEVLAGWAQKARLAEKRGFDGLRATGDTSWLSMEDWDKFVEYESSICGETHGKKMLVLCSYSLELWESYQMIDVVSTHEFALIVKDGAWRQIENSDRRKLTETALSLEEKYRRVVENIHVAVYSALPDEKSTTVLLTDKIEDITGFTAKEFLDRPELFSEMIIPEDREMVWSQMEEHRRGKKPLKVEYRIRTKSGELRWLKDEALPVLDEKGRILRIDGFVEDVTEHKSLEDALRSSRERYALAERAGSTGSWDWDIITGKLVWSDTIEPMFGFGPGGFGRTYEAFLECIHPDDRKAVTEAVQDCIDNRKEYDIEHRIIWPDGSIHWISERGDVIRNVSGKAVRMLGIARDVSRNKVAEQRIKHLNEDLENRSRQLDSVNHELEAFAYSVSHDLRAPLRRIDGFSEILLREESDHLSPDGKRHLERIRASVKSMDTLIEDILRLSRLNMGDLKQEEVDLSALAGEVIANLKTIDPERKVKVDIEKGVAVRGDTNLLKIALENLLGNAWKFSSKQPSSHIEFGTKSVNGKKTCFVRDNGVGFDVARSDKIFDPFQRLHSESEFPGSGIGLALVKRIVARHGGSIWAQSQLGKGATFYFTVGQKSE